jgi:hypothetical protein
MKGKEHVAKQLETVIPLNWKKAQLKDEIRRCETKGRNSYKEDPGVLSSGEEKQLGKIQLTLTCKRIRRPPTSRSDDFLW